MQRTYCLKYLPSKIFDCAIQILERFAAVLLRLYGAVLWRDKEFEATSIRYVIEVIFASIKKQL